MVLFYQINEAQSFAVYFRLNGKCKELNGKANLF